MSVKQGEGNQKIDETGHDNGTGNANEGPKAGSGEQNEQNEQNEPGDGDNANKPSGSGEKTFTQEDVNRMMTREKKQGRNSAYNELGIDPNDTKTIEFVKAIVGAQNGQAQEAGDTGNVAEQQNEQLAEAEHRAAVAEAKAEAMVLGVKPQFVDDVVTLATVRIAEQEGAEFKTIIGELKQKYPVWFGNADDDDSHNAGQKGTGSSIKSDSGSNGSNKEDGLGKRLAAQRKPSKKNFSYWGERK